MEHDFRLVHGSDITTRFLPDSSIEVVGDYAPGLAPEHVLFDFDGTLSLVREGWTEIMIPMMVEVLESTGTNESPDHLRTVCAEFVMELTGKQTIYQMIRLAEEVEKRGGRPLEPLDYKNEYHDRLMAQIQSRRQGLARGRIPPGDAVVPGSFALLDGLAERGITMYLASGTDEKYVREEVELLTLGRYFGRHVYGAQDDYQSFSKARVIERILSENNVNGASLLGFGDGYVEIQNVYDAGGTAIAVASDETSRSGKPDAWKRDRLIGAGAHAVVPDYQDAGRLIQWLWGEG